MRLQGEVGGGAKTVIAGSARTSDGVPTRSGNARARGLGENIEARAAIVVIKRHFARRTKWSRVRSRGNGFAVQDPARPEPPSLSI
jgi:hypothetical protein